jgi:hypothetical protein
MVAVTLGRAPAERPGVSVSLGAPPSPHATRSEAATARMAARCTGEIEPVLPSPDLLVATMSAFRNERTARAGLQTS